MIQRQQEKVDSKYIISTKIVHNKSTLYSEFYFIFFILSTIYVFAVFEIKLSSKRISFRYLTYTIPKKIEQI
jgi:hypothetical protein